MSNMKIKKLLFCASLFYGISGSCHAEEKWYQYHHLYLQAGTYTHLIDNPDYAGRNLMIGLEAVKSNNKIFGIAVFDNSFGQFSQYAYVGKKWNFSGNFENFHAKLTAGILHGYEEPFDNELPFTTRNGWSPGIVPSIGYQKGRFGFDIMLLGYQGIMFSAGSNF